MFRKLEAKNLALFVALVAVYFLAGKLGLKLAYANASAVWPVTGIAIAALLILGLRVWPAIFAAAFLINIATGGTFAASLVMATGSTLEALAASYLVVRFAGGLDAFQRSQNIFRFALLAGILSTAISAAFGSTVLLLGGVARWPNYITMFCTWWLGDAV